MLWGCFVFARNHPTLASRGLLLLGSVNLLLPAAHVVDQEIDLINPLVIDLARSQFTFLEDCRARVEMVLGDGRLSLAREPDQQFDILIVDAFSGDSVPVHLLTREAFDLYFRHLKPTGVLAVHVTNKYLALAPVVHRIAGAMGKQDRLVEDNGNPSLGTFQSSWVLVSGRAGVFEQPEIHATARRVEDRPSLRIWTDDYSNLFQILR